MFEGLESLVEDPSLIINIIALLLLIVGVSGRKGSKKDMMRHGYLSILGFVMKMATVFVVMLPHLFTEMIPEISELSTLQLSFLVVKITLGIVGTALGVVCIVPWFFKPLKEMACLRVKRWMMPTFIVWALTVLLGAIIDITGIL